MNFSRNLFFITKIKYFYLSQLIIRYDSASAKRRNNKSGFFSTAIIYAIIAVVLIFGILLFILTNSQFFESTKIFPKNRTQNANDTNSGLQVIEISSRNVSEESPKARSKRLDSEDDTSASLSETKMPDSQKLVFYPSRTLKPPRTAQKMKAIHYTSLPPNHKISSRRVLDPRALNKQVTLMPRPNAYLQPPTGHSFYQNIQGAIQQNYVPQRMSHNHESPMPPNAFQVRGTYRQGRRLPPNHHAEPSNSIPNLISPYEINHMVNPNAIDGKIVSTLQPQSEKNYFRRKFRQPIASIPNYNIHAQDAANIYGNVLQSTPNSVQHVTERNGNPFSVMLDVLPMQGEESDYTSIVHLQRPSKFRPMMMNKFYQDPQYFNTMNFPQLMPRYPASYFRYHPQASNMYGTIHTGNGMMKPSQIVVHLNLYPKKNAPSHKRSSSEDDKHVQETRLHKLNLGKNHTNGERFNINFNINGHPENHAYRINQSSTEAAMTQNYFYDDEDDFGGDHSMSVAPSLVYKNIYRDKPFHYEYLRNSTLPGVAPTAVTTRNSKVMKTANQKHQYQVIERRPKVEKNNRKAFGPFY